MRVAIVGKGGVGKTTIAAYLSLAIAKRKEVVVVDADPTMVLTTLFGVNPDRTIAKLKRQLAGVKVGQGIIRLNPRVELSELLVEVERNTKLLALGGVLRAGQGCMCPEYALLRAVLRKLSKGCGNLVLDLEAGLEVAGRAVFKGFDVLLVVTDLAWASFGVAAELQRFGKELGVKHVRLVVNKAEPGLEGPFIGSTLPYCRETYEASLLGRLAEGSLLYRRVEELARELEWLMS